MCGRFSLTASQETLITHFNLTKAFVMRPRYNIAPSNLIPVIKNPGVIDFLHWGLKPEWINKENNPGGFINAREETLNEKPAFKKSFQTRRCLILADGYYEWKTVGRIKQPFYVRRKDNRVFAIAGIFERDTCALITTKANSLIFPLHERMPLIVPPEQYSIWLDIKTDPLLAKEKCLSTSFVNLLEFFPVSTKVNNPKTDLLECIRQLQ